MTTVVGANVSRLRRRHGWTQAELRDRLEPYSAMSRSTLAQVETGRRPVLVDDLLALAVALGVAPHLLLYPSVADDVQVGAASMNGLVLGAWLRDPAAHPLSAELGEEETEEARWAEAAGPLARARDEVRAAAVADLINEIRVDVRKIADARRSREEQNDG